VSEYEGEPPIGEVEAALGAYREAREAWRRLVAQIQDTHNFGVQADPSDERQLYQVAQRLVAQLGNEVDLPDPTATIAQIARGYLHAVEALSEYLRDMREHLEKVSRHSEP